MSVITTATGMGVAGAARRVGVSAAPAVDVKHPSANAMRRQAGARTIVSTVNARREHARAARSRLEPMKRRAASVASARRLDEAQRELVGGNLGLARALGARIGGVA